MGGYYANLFVFNNRSKVWLAEIPEEGETISFDGFGEYEVERVQLVCHKLEESRVAKSNLSAFNIYLKEPPEREEIKTFTTKGPT